MNTETATSGRPGVEAPYPRRWAAMAVLVAAFMLDLLNVTIVNVALPAIQRDLRAGPADLEWISAAYLLAFAAALITFARVGDLLGRRRVFLCAVAAFALTGLWSGLADDVPTLIVSRAAQGLAAAAIAPQVMSILYSMFSGRERGTVFGVFGLVSGAAQAGGLVLGGALVGADLGGLGWHMIFLVTVPVAAALVALGAWLVPESRAAGGARPWWPASGVLTAGLVAIVFPLLEGRALGWPAWIWICLIAGIAALAGLAVVEHRRPERRAGALLPVALFRERIVTAALVVELVAFAAFSGFNLVILVWMQSGLGYSALDAGLTTIALIAGALALTSFVGRLTHRFGHRVILAGSLVAAAGSATVLVAAETGAADTTGWALVPGLLLVGGGTVLIMPPLTTLFLAAVPAEHAGSASGLWSTGQQFGATLGVAGVGTTFFAAADDGGYDSAISAGMYVVTAALVLATVLTLTLKPRPQGDRA
ncbi:MFS transporter [Actinomadura harenae]|nr:MFS transporter [Actinomadura harenae]